MSDFDKKAIPDKLNRLYKAGLLSEKYFYIITTFFNCYSQNHFDADSFELFNTFIDLMQKQLKEPFLFEAFHEKIQKPFNYYEFGYRFIEPLVDLAKSSLGKEENIIEIQKILIRQENVLLLANHQTESDPQLISLILNKAGHPNLAADIIYIAGERVTTDPLAIPFSMGCNLLCIYSKKHIDTDPLQKEKKQLHNQKTMQKLCALLSEGGKIVFAAPSGGRDRKNAQGQVEIAPFNPQSIEMLYLMAKKATRSSHFFPLTLSTYDILPPPPVVEKQLGEERIARRSLVHIYFGDEIDMQKYPGSDAPDKKIKRQNRANYIWSLVNDAYQKINRE